MTGEIFEENRFFSLNWTGKQNSHEVVIAGKMGIST